MNPRWFLKLSQLARNPPKASRVWLVLGVVAACLALAGVERLVNGAPEAPAKTLRPFTTN
ncbi:MAG: hypothetical protein KKB02_11280 [Alphaproteobacteria bacterium]|nr:hypothetical protein [Alphaproteobacteria bacterium]